MRHIDEKKKLNIEVDSFSKEMRRKLHIKRKKHCYGWDNDSLISNKELYEMLQEHVTQLLVWGEVDQSVDIANIAMFLWHRDKNAVDEHRRITNEKEAMQ